MANASPLAEVSEVSLDLSDLCRELDTVASKWFKIGIQLGVPYDKLQEFKNAEYPLAAVLDYCLKGNAKTPISWKAVVSALKLKDIGEARLADAIDQKYCQQKDSVEQTAELAEEEVTKPRRSPNPQKEEISNGFEVPTKASCSNQQGPNIKLSPSKLSPRKQQEENPEQEESLSKQQEEEACVKQKEDAYAGCYVFINHSNLWKAGQRVQGKKLRDTDVDSRYRIDLGNFLTMLAKGRNIIIAFLYGSRPPPNDSVWKAARDKNYTVKTYERSGSGKEKELNTSMACEITTCRFELDPLAKKNVTFIVVTGDRDLKTAIEGVLAKDIPVELWSWQDSMARELRQLANTNDLFTAQSLDSVEDKFSYTSYIRHCPRRSIDPTHAIVYKDAPKCKEFIYALADYLHDLMRLFYITPVTSGKPEMQDLIVEFPKTDPEIIFKKLSEHEQWSVKPCSWPEYTSSPEKLNLQQTNLFHVVENVDHDVLAESLKIDENYDKTTQDNNDWQSVLRRNPALVERIRRRRETRCKWGDHCAAAAQCPSKHTEFEKKMFERHPKLNFKYLKTRECTIDKHFIKEEQRKWCTFAHNEKDSWCLPCGMYGHLTANCKFK